MGMKCEYCQCFVTQAELDSSHYIFPTAESFCESCAKEFSRETARQTATHEIGGVSVVFTRAQADRWNAACTTKRDLSAIKVAIPVANNDCRYISLRRATNARLEPVVAAMLLNRAANRIGEWN